jgi:hypothetical protein
MLVATRAVLLPFYALRVETLVLHGEVVPVFALATGEDDFFTRHFSFLEFCLLPSTFDLLLSEHTTRIELVTSPLPRGCSTD